MQYHEKIIEIKNAFETAKQLVQQYVEENEKKNESQEDPENPIGVQNVIVGEKTAIAAPTGIAAFNVDGLTIHRLLQLPVEHGYSDKYKPLSDHVLKVLRAELKDHILLLGDLLQLPPVHEEPAYVQLSESKTNKLLGFLNVSNIWVNLFEYEELKINKRQQGDETFRDLLSKIRIGVLTKTDCDKLEKRKISLKGETFDEKLENLSMLKRISSNKIILIAEDTIDCISFIKKRVTKELSEKDEDNSRTADLVKKIVIKIGAKIMIRRNIDASLGLVNGTIAKVISVVKETSQNNIDKI
ncbi:uncharacterized protein [Cardiocondyla obscurior]|uniref:uncharacterized protein n=1 Tax=Cardiocondyla obscurior TaxID=286306 RepID=UPI0039656F96